ncbi:MAG: DedA family protein [Alphaproteobacteria bacterium]|nr:DedA family protein [Alphaproteobacteria bacterium]
MIAVRQLRYWLADKARHPRALMWLALMSFLDSCISPISPKFLFVPIVVARPDAWLAVSNLTAITAIAGAVPGYFIGWGLFEAADAWFSSLTQNATVLGLQARFDEFGFWIVILGGLTPVPFKFVAIASGAAQMPFWVFLSATTLSRVTYCWALGLMVRRFGNGRRKMSDPALWWPVAAFLIFAVGLWHWLI